MFFGVVLVFWCCLFGGWCVVIFISKHFGDIFEVEKIYSLEVSVVGLQKRKDVGVFR